MKLRILCLATLLTLAITACTSPQAPETASPDTDSAQTVTETAPKPGEPTDPLARGAQSPDATMPQRDTTPVDANVTDVRLSNSGDTENHTLGAPIDRFAPTDTVYAEIETTGTANGYNLYAKWIAADGTVLSDYGMRVDEAGPKRTVISLSKPDGWPQGTHSIELAINGKTERTVNFEVR